MSRKQIETYDAIDYVWESASYKFGDDRVKDVYPCDRDYPDIWNATHPNSDYWIYLWDLDGVEEEYLNEFGIEIINNEGYYAVEVWKE
jgi:hypothetical protein